MWPWGHLAVAYVLYSLYSRARFRRPPRPAPALAAAFGSQFPDLIDKPLAWGLGVLPGGRTLAHSLAFAGPVLAAVFLAALVYDRVEPATAFAIAHLSHLATDLSPRVALGYPFGSEYLFWPFLARPFAYGARAFEPPDVVALAVRPFTDPSTYFGAQFALFALALGLWYLDGSPGRRYLSVGSGGGPNGRT